MTLIHILSFVCFLTAASAVTVHYPSINSSETLTCNCPDHQCQKVLWYRYLQDSSKLEFIVSTTNLNNPHYANNIDQSRFRIHAMDSTRVSYTLRITDIQKEDAGFYSCMLMSQNSAQDPKDLMPEGYSIRPGEGLTTPATTSSTVKKKTKPLPNICKSNNQSPKGCKSLVLWSGISAVVLLAVILISTLYYFSRLPKKCRHHFARKQQFR